MELKLSRSTIREWHPGDRASLVRNANNRKVWINLQDRFPHPYTDEHAKEWLRIVATTTPVTAFAIDVGGEAVGGIGLTLQADVFHRSAEIGYWLGEDSWGRGIMTEAVQAVTRWAFERFDLCRIYAGVFEWNPTSMRVLEKAGYRLEGRLRKAVTKDWQTLDQFLYAIVRPEP